MRNKSIDTIDSAVSHKRTDFVRTMWDMKIGQRFNVVNNQAAWLAVCRENQIATKNGKGKRWSLHGVGEYADIVRIS